MHLFSLTLTNVRQFERRTFKFQPGFNLLVGENGAGKTTILRGLLAALGSARQTGRRPRLEDDDIRLRERTAEVCAVVCSANKDPVEFGLEKSLWEPAKHSARRKDLPLVLLYSSNEAICSSMKVKRAKGSSVAERESFRTSEEFLYAIEKGFPQGSRVASGRRFGDSRSVKDFVGRALHTFSPDMVEFYWIFEPYECSLVSASGGGASESLDASTHKLARAFAMRKLQERRLERKAPYSWPDQSKVVLYPNDAGGKRGERNLPRLNDVWAGMKFPSEAIRDLIMSCSLEVKLTPRIMLRRKIGELSLKQMSDGEQRLFSLFVDIARQLSLGQYHHKLGEGEAIILVDEIDVHLHPKWQRRIVPALEDLFPNCQFIATTHSPFVIQAVGRERVTFIDSHSSSTILGGGNSLEDIAEDVQGVPQPQRSVRAQRLSSAAKHYFTLIEAQERNPGVVRPSDLLVAEQTYRDASEPFTSDPALHALLTILLKDGVSK
ncbi:AAA family ATPase [Stenotrophomonas sp. PS02300]|uniref:AAA family ATPase n=1 Tax=Stenotrophomonas sp. PS02300 TaxID=2991426 RepID=UPI00249C80A6|nr:AAA family ATPase [Stenotrophomonas sp. PS02300]